MNVLDDLGFIFADALAEVISKVSGISLNNSVLEHDGAADEMIGVMNLNGKSGGTFFVSAREADMRTLCSHMIGVPLHEVTKEDIGDTLCEFVNMTAGNAKLRLSSASYSFMLTVPFIISGGNLAIHTKKKKHITARVLSDGKISLKVKFIHSAA